MRHGGVFDDSSAGPSRVATGRIMPDPPTGGWKDEHPIVNVTWADAKSYADWAGVQLPTEAQWEKAARGMHGRRYVWGDDWPPSAAVGNLADQFLSPVPGYKDGHRDTAPVGSFRGGVSPYGCLDMVGNVWEWCADWYGKGYYGTGPDKNPTGPATGDSRVARGGSFFSLDRYAYRVSRRMSFQTGRGGNFCCNDLGFRCVLPEGSP